MDKYFQFEDVFNNSIAVEYKKLRNNFCLLTKAQEPVKSVLVVGSVHREGASAVARNFAKAMAEDPGSNVLLMDLNYRSPSIASLKKRPKGASDAFLEEAELEDVIATTDTENLFLLPCGLAQCDPHRMVNSKRFAELLAKLQRRFHLVVIDSSPIQYYPESTLLASKVGGVLLVVCAESTRREIVADAQKKIETTGGKVLGVVLNRRKHYIPKLIYNRL